MYPTPLPRGYLVSDLSHPVGKPDIQEAVIGLQHGDGALRISSQKNFSRSQREPREQNFINRACSSSPHISVLGVDVLRVLPAADEGVTRAFPASSQSWWVWPSGPGEASLVLT